MLLELIYFLRHGRPLFVTFMGSPFHSLWISGTVHNIVEHRAYKWEFPDEAMLWTSGMEVAHDFVVRAGGEALRTIIIGGHMYDEARYGREMVGDLLKACPNVRSLSAIDPFGIWSSALASQLEKLEVVTENPKGAIPNHCSS